MVFIKTGFHDRKYSLRQRRLCIIQAKKVEMIKIIDSLFILFHFLFITSMINFTYRPTRVSRRDRSTVCLFKRNMENIF